MYLKSGNLVIRNANAGDAQALCNWWNDGRIMAHAGFPNGIGTTEQEVLDKLKTDSDRGRRLILEIDHVPVGEMNYRTVEENVAEIGIKICDFSQQEKGFGTTFLTMLISFLFEQLLYHTIILDTNVKNTGAQHVYEKIGFRKMAVRIDTWKNQLGELQSSIDYELTREEYLKSLRFDLN
ncbi:RimJ/RimL family protein N-acetyltransferase [Paenibacillus forsythiae]|uniref:RimJ/RimL family protein N-acetyltransferase n=1 Tax=Paenibacillus forsythiae TaxID=365616 RepID=A0ABU3HG50_9BACL|nr:GNAT family protein [Paenibacillus forsythiae]MDT3428655.1 RimJ/RimL family protein N-acetyltransferase [Paenibacillus forsythiae]